MSPNDGQAVTDEVLKRVSIWRLGGMPPLELLRRVWHELYEGGLLSHAAALAFYFFFAIFPLLLILATLMAYFGEIGHPFRDDSGQVIGAKRRCQLVCMKVSETSQG